MEEKEVEYNKVGVSNSEEVEPTNNIEENNNSEEAEPTRQVEYREVGGPKVQYENVKPKKEKKKKKEKTIEEYEIPKGEQLDEDYELKSKEKKRLGEILRIAKLKEKKRKELEKRKKEVTGEEKEHLKDLLRIAKLKEKKKKEDEKYEQEYDKKTEQLNKLIEKAAIDEEARKYGGKQQITYADFKEQEQKIKSSKLKEAKKTGGVITEQLLAHAGYTRQGLVGGKIDQLKLKNLNEKIQQRESLVKNLERIKRQKIEKLRKGKLTPRDKKELDKVMDKIVKYKLENKELKGVKQKIKTDFSYKYFPAKKVGQVPAVQQLGLVKETKTGKRRPVKQRRKKADSFEGVLKKLKTLETKQTYNQVETKVASTPEVEAQKQLERPNALNENKMTNAYGVEDWILKI